MTKSAIALCAAQPLGGDGVPEWLHLLPAGPIVTHDGRGPYRVVNAEAVIATSLQASDKLVLDENHSTDLAAPKGASAPAMGWIVELQHRSDGIWGKVDWTAAGRSHVEDRAYRGVSPVIAHRKDGTILGILRASLTNKPNFSGLQSLHQEEDDVMEFRNKLIEALGLASDADDEAILAAIKAALAKGGETQTALQAALSPIATAAGLAADADATAVLAGVEQLAKGAGGDSQAIVALQGEITNLTNQLNAVAEGGARAAAIAYVDGAIAAGHMGVKPLRDRYITMHMADAKGTEELIGAMPRLKGGAVITGEPPKGEAGELGEADKRVVSLMGIDPAAYKETLAERETAEETL